MECLWAGGNQCLSLLILSAAFGVAEHSCVIVAQKDRLVPEWFRCFPEWEGAGCPCCLCLYLLSALFGLNCHRSFWPVCCRCIPKWLRDGVTVRLVGQLTPSDVNGTACLPSQGKKGDQQERGEATSLMTI